jgi:3-hydroxyacyl-CoA dehydrogenase
LDAGRDRIVKSLDKLVEKQKMTMQFADETLGRIEFTTDIDALRDTDFIVEAIIENMALKEDLFATLGEVCKPETIFASNTSSLSIGEMAASSGRPQNFVGVHFFNPVQVRSLDFVRMAAK